MKVQEIIHEDQEREFPNPVPFNQSKVYDVFDLADEVEGELVSLYKQEHGIDEFVSGREYGKAAKIQRQKYGKIADIPINNITSSESHLYKPQVDALVSGAQIKTSSDIPILYKVGNEYIVGDGNHRVTAELLKGNKSVKALVLDLSELSKQLKIENKE